MSGGAWLLLAALPHVAVVIYWHSVNNSLPLSDAANYLFAARRLYLEYADGGIRAFLEAFYTIRDWRPIIYPSLASIAMVVSDGSLLLTIGLTDTVFSILFCAWTYLLLRLHLERRAAVIGTWLCTAVPFYTAFAFTLLSETAMVAMALGAIYHLIRSEYFANRLHSYAFALVFGLLLCIRPVEAFLNLALPLSLYFGYGYVTKRFQGHTLAFAAAIIVCTAGILICMIPDETVFAWLRWPRRAFALALITGVAYLAGRRRFGVLLRATLAWCMFSLIWWYREMGHLFTWVYSTSFGWLATYFPGEGKQQFPGVLFFYIGELYSSVAFVAAAALVLIVVILCLARRKHFRELGFATRPELLFFCSAVIPVLVVSVMSPASSVRRGMLAFLILMIAMTAIGLHGPRMAAARMATAFAAFGFPFLVFLSTVFGVEQEAKDHFPLGAKAFEAIGRSNDPAIVAATGGFFTPVSTRPSSAEKVYNWVYGHVSPEKTVIAPLDEPHSRYDSFTLNVLALGNAKKFGFRMPVEGHDVATYFLKLGKSDPGVQYVLLEVLDGLIDKPAGNFISAIPIELNNAYHQGRLHEYGLREAHSLIISKRSKAVLFSLVADERGAVAADPIR